MDKSTGTIHQLSAIGNHIEGTTSYGGGLYFGSSEPYDKVVITNSSFTDNHAGISGGGMYFLYYGSGEVKYVLIHLISNLIYPCIHPFSST